MGLPTMLAYKKSRQYCEILMTHGGSSLKQWIAHIIDVQQRVEFAAEMLKQIIPALKTLHGVGYTHGDIKLDNICARVGSDGN